MYLTKVYSIKSCSVLSEKFHNANVRSFRLNIMFWIYVFLKEANSTVHSKTWVYRCTKFFKLIVKSVVSLQFFLLTHNQILFNKIVGKIKLHFLIFFEGKLFWIFITHNRYYWLHFTIKCKKLSMILKNNEMIFFCWKKNEMIFFSFWIVSVP